MHCPKHDVPCRTKRLDTVRVDVCPRCQGVWIEQGAVKQLAQRLLVPNNTSADELIAAWEVAEHEGTLPKEFWQETRLDCPRGHGHMGKHYFGGSHIGVDQCQTCLGFWLDGGELKAVAREITPDPMLERAWQTAIRDQIDFRKKMQKMASVPATIASYFVMAKSIPMLFAITGAVLLKVVIDSVIEAERYRL